MNTNSKKQTQPTSTLTAATVCRIDKLYRSAAWLHDRARSHIAIGGDDRRRRGYRAIKAALRLERRAWLLLDGALCADEQFKLTDLLCAANAKAKAKAQAA